MAIFIDAATQSDLADYSGLIRAIGRWLQRDDLADDAPDFIRLAEARLRDILVMPEMETMVTLAAGGSVPLPADFDSARSIFLPGAPRQKVEQVSPSTLSDRQFDTPGLPTIFAILAETMQFSPAPTTQTPVVLTYRARLPALTSTVTTNWLLQRRPDIYLYASLVQAEFYGWNDDRLPLIKSALDEAMGECNQAGNRKRYGAGPLVMRPDRVEAAVGAYRR